MKVSALKSGWPEVEKELTSEVPELKRGKQGWLDAERNIGSI